MRRFRLRVARGWRPFVGVGLASALVVGLLVFRLGSLTPGFSQAEIDERQRASTISNLINQPLQAPHATGQYILQKVGLRGPTAMRSVSVVVGLLVVLCLFLVLRSWHGTRIALIGSLLFTTSSWFLHTARLATVDSSFMLLIGLVLCAIWLQQSKLRKSTLLATTVIVSLLLYIPGAIGLVLIGTLWQIKRIVGEMRDISVSFMLLSLFVGVVLLTPLVIGLVQDSSQLRTWAGLPEKLPSISAMAKNVASVPVQLVARGPNDPVRWLGRLPLLDAFSTAMLVIGLYAYAQRLKLDRTKLLIGVFGLGGLLISLGGPIPIALFLPFVYIIVAAGLAYMLRQWFIIFPRNPLARNLAVGLMSIAVLLVTFYQLSHYFVAWPNAPPTKQAFSIKP